MCDHYANVRLKYAIPTGGTDNLGDIGKFFVGGDGDRLNEELVSTFCIQGGILFHSLQQDWIRLVT